MIESIYFEKEGKTVTRSGVSTVTGEIVDLLCEGEIEGLVSGSHSYVGTAGLFGYSSATFSGFKSNGTSAPAFLRSIYFNEEPILDTAGDLNFQNVNVRTVTGGKLGDTLFEIAGKYLQGANSRTITVTAANHGLIVGGSFDATILTGGARSGSFAVASVPDANTFTYTATTVTAAISGKVILRKKEILKPEPSFIRSINERLRGPTSTVLNSDNVQQGLFPKYYRVLNKDVKKLEVNIRVASLFKTDPKEVDIQPTSVEIRVSYRPIKKGEHQPAFTLAALSGIQGALSSPYVRSIEIDLKEDLFSLGWEIKIERSTIESTDSTVKNQTFVESIAEIYSVNLSYPNSALAYSSFDAEYFSAIPDRYYDVKMMKVLVPNGYDPITKSYPETWNGTFKLNKEWSDNPAWCFYDLIKNPRYGLGKYIDTESIDKWTLYSIARYCDQLVSDGEGSVEPRFTCNLLIQSREEAFKVINDMASIFRSIIYYFNGSLYSVQDSPKISSYKFTNANVINGEFIYSNSSLKTRHTVAIIRYNDKSNFYKPAVEYIEDVDGIKRFGYREIESAAFGCSSRGQAIRFGRWMLTTERTEIESVSFKTGAEGSILRPGDVIGITDFNKNRHQRGGRVISIKIDSAGKYAVTLDRQIENLSTISENAGVTIDTSTDIVTKVGHGYITGSQVKFSGTVPTSESAITASTVMFVRKINTNTFTLHATASDAAAKVNFTAASATYTLALINRYSLILSNPTARYDALSTPPNLDDANITIKMRPSQFLEFSFSSITPSSITPSSLIDERSVSVITLDSLTLSDIPPFATWVIKDSGQVTNEKQYRVININEDQDNSFSVSAIEYNDSKYAAIDEGAPLSFSGETLAPPPPVTSFTLSERPAIGSSEESYTPKSIIITVILPTSRGSMTGINAYIIKGGTSNPFLNNENPESGAEILDIRLDSTTTATGEFVPTSTGRWWIKIFAVNAAGGRFALPCTAEIPVARSISIIQISLISKVVVKNLRLSNDSVLNGEKVSDNSLTNPFSSSYSLVWDVVDIYNLSLTYRVSMLGFDQEESKRVIFNNEDGGDLRSFSMNLGKNLLVMNQSKISRENTGVTIDTTTDTVTKVGHGYITGSQVKFLGTVPTSDPVVTASTVMFVRKIDANNFTLHATAAGTAAKVNFTAASDTYTLVGGSVSLSTYLRKFSIYVEALSGGTNPNTNALTQDSSSCFDSMLIESAPLPTISFEASFSSGYLRIYDISVGTATDIRGYYIFICKDDFTYGQYKETATNVDSGKSTLGNNIYISERISNLQERTFELNSSLKDLDNIYYLVMFYDQIDQDKEEFFQNSASSNLLLSALGLKGGLDMAWAVERDLFPYDVTPKLMALVPSKNTGVTIDTTTDTVTKVGHGYITGSQVKFSGTVPTSDPVVTASTVMFVRKIDANNFTLHATAAGTAAKVNFTAASDTYTLKSQNAVTSTNAVRLSRGVPSAGDPVLSTGYGYKAWIRINLSGQWVGQGISKVQRLKVGGDAGDYRDFSGYLPFVCSFVKQYPWMSGFLEQAFQWTPSGKYPDETAVNPSVVGVNSTVSSVSISKFSQTVTKWNSPLKHTDLSNATKRKRAAINGRSATYTQAKNSRTITVKVTNTPHGLFVGERFYATITSGAATSGYFAVASVPDANTFTYTATTVTAAISGTIQLTAPEVRDFISGVQSDWKTQAMYPFCGWADLKTADADTWGEHEVATSTSSGSFDLRGAPSQIETFKTGDTRRFRVYLSNALVTYAVIGTNSSQEYYVPIDETNLNIYGAGKQHTSGTVQLDALYKNGLTELPLSDSPWWKHHSAGFGQGWGGLQRTSGYFDVHLGHLIDFSYLREGFFGVVAATNSDVLSGLSPSDDSTKFW